MKFIGNIDLDQNLMQNMVLDQLPDFPLVPKKGQVVFKGMKLYMCVDIVLGSPVWIALTNELNSFIFTQGTPASTWGISHVSDDNNVIVQVYDAANKQMIPNDIDVSVPGVITIDFGSAQAGHAVVVYRVKGQAEPVSDPVAPILSFNSWNGEGGPELKTSFGVRPGNIAAISPSQFVTISPIIYGSYRELLLTSQVSSATLTTAANDSTEYTFNVTYYDAASVFQTQQVLLLGSDIQTIDDFINAVNAIIVPIGISASLTPGGFGIGFRFIDSTLKEMDIQARATLAVILPFVNQAVSTASVLINTFAVNETTYAVSPQSSILVPVDDVEGPTEITSGYLVSLGGSDLVFGTSGRVNNDVNRYYVQKLSVDAFGNITLGAKSDALIPSLESGFIDHRAELTKISNTTVAVVYKYYTYANQIINTSVAFFDVSVPKPVLILMSDLSYIDAQVYTVGDVSTSNAADFVIGRMVSADRFFVAQALRAKSDLQIDPFTRTTVSEVRVILFDTSTPVPTKMDFTETSVFSTNVSSTNAGIGFDYPFEMEVGLPGTVVLGGVNWVGNTDFPTALAFTVSGDSISGSSYATLGSEGMYYYLGLVHMGNNQFILGGDTGGATPLKTSFFLFNVTAGEITGVREVTDAGTIFPDGTDDVSFGKLSDSTFVISHSQGGIGARSGLRVQNLA